MNALRRFFKQWWPTVIVIAVVLYATLWPDPLPDEADDMFFEHMDKLIHAIMMGGIVAAVLFDWRRAGHYITLRVRLLVAMAVAVFSPVDELLQAAMMLGRSADWLDLAADWLGIFVALLSAPPVINRIFRHRPVVD